MGEGFQFIDILLFGMIAAFLVIRLRSVLGRRTGHEKRRDAFGRGEEAQAKGQRDTVIPLPGRAPPRAEEPAAEPVTTPPAADAGPLQPGVDKIRTADASFDPQGFMAGARAAFEMIVTAFAQGDTEALRPLLSDEVFDNFNNAIEARRKAGETLETTLVGITSAEMLEADLVGRNAVVTVKFVSEQVNVTRDAQGQVVDGDPAAVTNVTDIWTFARDVHSTDPDWFLVATRSPN